MQTKNSLGRNRMQRRYLKCVIGGFLLCTIGSPIALAAEDSGNSFGFLPSCTALSPNVDDIQEEAALSRQDIREEMLKIRADHEEWEEQRDALKLQCLNAKGQDQSQCLVNGRALKEQQQAMQARLKTLHEKLAVMRRDHHGAEASNSAPPVARPVAAPQ